MTPRSTPWAAAAMAASGEAEGAENRRKRKAYGAARSGIDRVVDRGVDHRER